MRHLIVVCTLIALGGCVAPSARMTEQLRVGMTRADVIKAMGRPASVGGDRQGEFLYYRLLEGDVLGMGGETVTFAVRLIDGQVDSFTRVVEPRPTSVMQPMPPPPPLAQ